jgi:hypothetical protein
VSVSSAPTFTCRNNRYCSLPVMSWLGLNYPSLTSPLYECRSSYSTCIVRTSWCFQIPWLLVCVLQLRRLTLCFSFLPACSYYAGPEYTCKHCSAVFLVWGAVALYQLHLAATCCVHMLLLGRICFSAHASAFS